MDYFSCKEAFGAILAKEEAAGNAGKTLFGNVRCDAGRSPPLSQRASLSQFKSELLHAWSVAVREYEKNNIYLGEAARNMSQFTGYEMCGRTAAIRVLSQLTVVLCASCVFMPAVRDSKMRWRKARRKSRQRTAKSGYVAHALPKLFLGP